MLRPLPPGPTAVAVCGCSTLSSCSTIATSCRCACCRCCGQPAIPDGTQLCLATPGKQVVLPLVMLQLLSVVAQSRQDAATYVAAVPAGSLPTQRANNTGAPPPCGLQTHLGGQGVLVGAGDNVQGAAGLVVAQPAPARALAQQAASSSQRWRYRRLCNMCQPGNSACPGMTNTAAEVVCMHEEWKVLGDNKTHRLVARRCCCGGFNGPHWLRHCMSAPPPLPTHTCTAAVCVLKVVMNLSRLPHLASMADSSSPLGGQQSCRHDSSLGLRTLRMCHRR